jgi:hypothetical protein
LALPAAFRSSAVQCEAVLAVVLAMRGRSSLTRRHAVLALDAVFASDGLEQPKKT